MEKNILFILSSKFVDFENKILEEDFRDDSRPIVTSFIANQNSVLENYLYDYVGGKIYSNKYLYDFELNNIY